MPTAYYNGVSLNTKTKTITVREWIEVNSNRLGLDHTKTYEYKTIREAIDNHPECADDIIRSHPEYADRINEYVSSKKSVELPQPKMWVVKAGMDYSTAREIVRKARNK